MRPQRDYNVSTENAGLNQILHICAGILKEEAGLFVLTGTYWQPSNFL